MKCPSAPNLPLPPSSGDPTVADLLLEWIIAAVTSAIVMARDPRLVELQRVAIAMRSPAQKERMDRDQGLA